MSRAEAARLAGMERQALRDAVVRYNAEGLAGLVDRPKYRRPRLTEGQQATPRALILHGPSSERDDISSWTRADIAELIEQRFGHCYHVSSPSEMLRQLGFSRQKARPVHPKSDPKAQAAWKKRAAGDAGRDCHRASGQADRPVFQDETRSGQTGRVCHRWWLRGLCPPGLVDQRHDFAYVFAAIEPATGRTSASCCPRSRPRR